MSSVLLTAPAVEPLSLDEAKAFLRVEHGDDDDVIAALIAGSRIHVESRTRRALITQSWRLSADVWPPDGRLPVVPGPLQALTAARVYDFEGMAHDVDIQAFVLDKGASLLAFAPWAVPARGRFGIGASRVSNNHRPEGDGIMWDKIKAWFRHSLTILWARVVALAGLLLVSAQSLLSDPSVSAAIQTALQPKFIPYYVIAIGLVTEIARRRTAAKE